MLELERDVFGLTGGMGSGKSTVSEGLAKHGAVIVDADQIVHDLQAPGMPVLTDMALILGSDVIEIDGSLNRKLAGERMFADKARRQAVQATLSALIIAEMKVQVEAADQDAIVVLDVPLLIETGMTDVKGIMVVDTPVDLAVSRLMQYRGFSEAEARSRIASQLSREERLAHADYVIRNDGTREELEAEIMGAWRWIQEKNAE